MILAAACLALAPQQVHQSVFPKPPGGPFVEFGRQVAYDDDRAVVAMELPSGEPAYWSYRRDGLDWELEAPFPAGLFPASGIWFDFGNTLELQGDVAVVSRSVCQEAHELWFDGTAWTTTWSGPHVFVDVDLDSGDAVGFTSTLVERRAFERTAAGWVPTQQLTTAPHGGFGIQESYAIEGDVIAVGAQDYFHCGHFTIEGRVWILERDVITGLWSEAATFTGPFCSNWRLGDRVVVEEGVVFAFARSTRDLHAYERDSNGTWVEAPPIGLPFPGALVSFAQSHFGAEGDLFVPVQQHSSQSVEIWRVSREVDGSWTWTNAFELVGFRNIVPSTCRSLPTRVQLAPVPLGLDGRVGLIALARDLDQCEFNVVSYAPEISNSNCTATSNSTGEPATLHLAGDYMRTGETQFAAGNLPLGQSALPLFSQNAGFLPNPGGSAGNLCIGQPFVRVNSQFGTTDPQTGTFRFTLDFDALGLASIPLGTPVHFQLWFRDRDPLNVPTSNFTNGVTMRLW